MKGVAVALMAWLTVTLLAAAPAETPAPPGPPRLIVVLALDQLRYDYLPRLNDLFKGGFRKLLDNGAVFTNANYRHAATETGPGHSVILSGRHPSSSGVVGNVWWDPYLKARVNVVDDPTQTAVGGSGRGASPVNFIGFTVGDVLKQKQPDSRVVTAALKDRSAVLLAGRSGDAAYWFEGDGNFITSTYYMPKAPEWLVKWNMERSPDRYAGKTWTRLLNDRALYEKYSSLDNMPGEADGRDNVFPHAIQGVPPARNFYASFDNTPFADEVTLSFAIEAMKAHHLGQDAIPDILGIGFSATDYIGHRYGPESQEVMDQLLRLDQLLDQLFKYLDGTIGLSNTLIVVTADHGATPLVEGSRAKGIDARRGTRAEVETAIRRAFASKYPRIEGLIADLTAGGTIELVLDEDVIRRNNLATRDVEETASKAVMATGLAVAAYTKSDLLEYQPSADPYIQLFRNSFFAPRSPNVQFLPKKYLSFTASGSSHGSAYEYDTHVPIIFMGPGIKSGTYSDAAGPEDIAPTLARILGLTFPKEFDSRILTEMLN